MNPYPTLAATLLARWQRQHVAIRCGLYPSQPALIRSHLGLGRRLVREGTVAEAAAQQRMLKLLLDTALDEALPWFWRSVCLEHAVWPLARLQSLLDAHSANAAQSWNSAFQAAQARLPAPPKAAA